MYIGVNEVLYTPGIRGRGERVVLTGVRGKGGLKGKSLGVLWGGRA